PILSRLIDSFQDALGCCSQHYCSRGQRIILRHKVLRHPAFMRRPPKSKRCAPSFFVAGGQHIEERFPTTQHPPPVLPDSFEMRNEAGSFGGIEKACLFV